MEHFYKNIGENWFNYQNIYKEMIHRFKSDSHFIEIGSWKGRSSVYMAVEIINSGYDIKFDCIDTWQGSVEHKNYEIIENNSLFDEFINNIQSVSHIINPIKLDSVTASKLYENASLDFIFIDASHEYEDIKNDILHWKPKVKKNGILAGHDYKWPDVKRAVGEIFNIDKVIKKEQCWIVDMELIDKPRPMI